MLPRFMAGGQSVEGALKFKAPADGEALEELDTQTITASGTVTLVRRGAASGETRMKSNVILFDCNGADRILKMPVASSWKGEVTVRNISSGAYTVEVQTAAAVSTGYIDQSEAAKVWSLGTGTTIYMNGMAKVTASPDDFGVDGIKTDKIVESTLNNGVRFGVDGTGYDVYFYGDTAGRAVFFDQSLDSMIFLDSTILGIGSGAGAGADITFSWDGTRMNVNQLTADSEIRWGVDGAGIDQRWYGDTASVYLLWDQSRDSAVLSDNAHLGFGSGAGAAADIEMYWDGTDLLVTQLTADSIVKWGVSGAGINHVFYGDTATYDMTWDQTNNQLLFNDNASASFGTGAGAAGDISVAWDGTRLNVTQLTPDSEIRWGVDGAGIDQMWYGDTAGRYMTWDQTADQLIISDGASIGFGTPGTDATFTPDGTDLVVSGTGDLVFADSFDVAWGAGKDVTMTGDGTNVVMGGSGALLAKDTTFLVADPADTTKRARFDVGGVTPGQTRISVLPDADIGVLGVMYANQAASTAITGTQEAKTAFDTKKTIGADVLKAGSVLHVVAQGIHTATSGAETHTISLELGSVVIDTNAGIDPANSDIFAWEVWVVIRTVGTGGTMVAYGRKRIGAAGTAEVPFILGSTAIDTTITNDIAVYIDRQATATDSDSARLDIMIVELSG